MDEVKQIAEAPPIFTGENDHTIEARSNQSPSDLAQEVLERRAASVQESVSSASAYTRGVAAFRDDEEQKREFLQILVEHKVLSAEHMAREISGKKSAATASKLKKIADFSHVVLHPEILPYLEAGYSNLYELVLLYEQLPGDSDAAIAALRKLIQEHDGPVTRKWLEDERKNLKASDDDAGDHKKSPEVEDETAATSRVEAPAQLLLAKSEDPAGADAELEEEIDEEVADDESANGDLSQEDDDEPLAVVLFTAESAGCDLGWVSAVSDKLAEDAVVAIIADMATLCSLTSAAAVLGFNRPSTVYLLSQPVESNITGLMAVAVYERSTPSAVRAISTWPTTGDAMELADYLFEDITGPRVHVASVGSTDGPSTMN